MRCFACALCSRRGVTSRGAMPVCGLFEGLHLQTSLGDKLHSRGAWLLGFIILPERFSKGSCWVATRNYHELSIRHSMANQYIDMVGDCRDML